MYNHQCLRCNKILKNEKKLKKHLNKKKLCKPVIIEHVVNTVGVLNPPIVTPLYNQYYSFPQYTYYPSQQFPEPTLFNNTFIPPQQSLDTTTYYAHNISQVYNIDPNVQHTQFF